uniref:Thioredoxin domain-containing protein n=1 Tax=Glycine max TaxID=3847 RepID=K7M773_SOYBN
MALENCVAVTTVGTSARPQCLHPFSKREKLVFPTFRGFKKSLTKTKSRFICNAREAVDEVRAVTDSSWNNIVIASETPLHHGVLAKEYAGKIACFKLNTDDCPNIATEYGIRSIATVLLFKNGEKKA